MPKKELPKEASVEAKEATERVLKARFGRKVEVDAGKPLKRAISRFRILDASDDVPTSVIAKQHKGDRGRRMFNEWAGLQLLNECYDPSTPAPMPMFYGGDCEESLIVIEDLGDDDRLDDVVMGDDVDRTHRAVIDFARCMGQVQACTVGKRVRFEDWSWTYFDTDGSTRLLFSGSAKLCTWDS